ncbi:MAG TPA: PD-(D/E)XK nuclease family protein [bacterium]|nr:PD-(D/E)XK nuclease family protein [bacterium]
MIKGIYCKRREAVLDLNECIECSKTNFECQIFTEYLIWLNKDDSEYSKDLTVTKLLSCPRRAYFYAHLDYIIEPEDFYALFRGSIIHSFLQTYKDSECIVETRFTKKYKNIEISGTPDKIDTKRKIIYDFKTIAGRISDDYSLRWDNPHLEHQVQLNLYYWLLKDIFEIERLCLVYIGSDCSKKYLIKIRTEDDKKLYTPIKKAFDNAEILNQVWNKNLNEINKKDLPKITEIDKKQTWICNYCHFEKECKDLG